MVVGLTVLIYLTLAKTRVLPQHLILKNEVKVVSLNLSSLKYIFLIALINKISGL